MSGKIFISYRRGDGSSHAVNVEERLRKRFGKRKVFCDVSDIKPGDAIPMELQAALVKARVMVSVMGPDWVGACDGKRRIDASDDWVRQEIKTAFDHGIRVIPVLVNGAKMPAKADLPEDICKLASCNAKELTPNGLRHDLDGLARDITELWPRWKKWTALGVGVVAATLAVTVPATFGIGPPEPVANVVAQVTSWVRRIDTTEKPKDSEKPPSPPPKPGTFKAVRDCTTFCPELVEIKSGEFNLGSQSGEAGRGSDEALRRRVVITRPFYIGRYEVTYGEFRAFIESTDHSHKPKENCETWSSWRRAYSSVEGLSWAKPGYENGTKEDMQDMPVTCVSWEDAQQYAEWLRRKTGKRYRLPSEAEWEYAARARSVDPYTFGTELTVKLAHFVESGWLPMLSGGKPVSVRFKDGSGYDPNGEGLYHVHGNAQEWVQDCYQSHARDWPVDQQPVPEKPRCSRVAKGGSWFGTRAQLRSAARAHFPPDTRRFDLGFRVARDP